MIIRPPSEAHSLLLQVTVGCSHNECTFCGSYKDKKFRIKDHEEINADILEAGKHYRSVEKVFLCDGDALVIPQRRLVPILETIEKNIHGVKRIGTYANTKSILRKSKKDLLELKDKGIGIVYLGIETGNEALLRNIKKGAGYAEIVEAGRRIKEVGIILSVTVLLGIGGTEKSLEHAADTAHILSDIDPDYVGVLTVMTIPGTPLYEDYRFSRFQLPGQFEILQELAVMISCSNFSNCFFTANHASNYLPIRARMPQDKAKVLRLIEEVIRRRDPSLLKPEYMRGL